MDDQPGLSIVIPVHNAESTLEEQLDAVLGSIDPDMEVILVDNRSTDTSRAIADRVASKHEQLRIVPAGERAGEAYARNTGWRAARSPSIAFCDADDVVSPAWARAMRDGLATAGFVTGPVELDRLNPAWLAGMRGRRIYEQLPRTIQDIPFAHGCNLGMRREVIEDLGGFADPAGHDGDQRRRGTGAEDIDLAIRASRAGVPLRWEERAMVHYRHRRRAGERWRQSVSYGIAAAHVHRLVGDEWDMRARVRRQRRRVRWLVTTLPLVTGRTHRARWLWTLGLMVGELRGDGW